MNGIATTLSPLPPTDPSMNFDLLRQEGIGHLEQLATYIWTDFNLHDPGITMLEVLCYAITDLGYRANFPIEAITAPAPGSEKQQDFFLAKDILPGEPVTPTDFVKLLIDVPQVRNAWLEKAESDSTGITQPMPNGVYKVWLDVDNALDLDDNIQNKGIIKAAYNRLMAHRPLCEDFLEPEIMPTVEISICLDIDLTPDAVPEEVKAEIMFRIQDYFTPSINQYSLKQLLEKGIPCDQIFSGPWLRNGFILDDEVTRAIPKRKLYRSDLYRLILGVSGVATVKSFAWGKCNNCNPTFTTDWCLCLCEPQTDGTLYKPLLDVKCSNYSFSQNGLPVDVVEEETKELLEWLRFKTENVADLSQNNPDYPQGDYHDWREYTSIQYDLPRVYAQAENELPETATPLRKAQAKQLRAFLLFFDQLLAGYLARLAEVRNLLSINQDAGAATSFAQTLLDVPGVAELVIPPDPRNPKAKTYEENLLAIVESTVQRQERKNQLLSHLLARFGEQFTDYSVALYGALRGTNDVINEPYTEYLSDKSAFLKELPVLTAQRSKGFNYRAKDRYDRPDVWDIPAANVLDRHICLNVEGVKKRVSRLLGWDSYSRRTLTGIPNFDVKISTRADKVNKTVYQFQVFDKNGRLLLSSVNDAKDVTAVKKQVDEFYKACQHADSCKVIADPKSKNKARLYIFPVDQPPTTKPLAQSDLLLEKDAQALNEYLKRLASPPDQQADGFHLIEHILLRPNDADDLPIIPFCTECYAAGITPEPNPYAFWVTVVVPAYTKRFQEEGFRRYFEQLVRLETPAHIAVRFCWVNNGNMREFETHYKRWLIEKARCSPDECHVDEQAKALIDWLNKPDPNQKPDGPIQKLWHCPCDSDTTEPTPKCPPANTR